MRRSALVMFLAMMAGSPAPLPASQSAMLTPAFHEEFKSSWSELSQTWADLAQGLRDWGERWREHLSARGLPDDGPLISLMLHNQEKLGLSAEQTRKLEQLRNEHQRTAIRSEANLRIAEMDLAALLDADRVDMANVEAKVREIERLRADFWISRLKTIEKGKQQLSAAQRKRLQELMNDSQLSRVQRRP